MDSPVPERRKRYIYELNDLDNALKLVKEDIEYIIMKLRKFETQEFMEKNANDKEVKGKLVGNYTAQFKTLLTTRDYIMNQITLSQKIQTVQ